MIIYFVLGVSDFNMYLKMVIYIIPFCSTVQSIGNLELNLFISIDVTKALSKFRKVPLHKKLICFEL